MPDAPPSGQPEPESPAEDSAEPQDQAMDADSEDEQPARVRIVSFPALSEMSSRFAHSVMMQLPGSTETAASFEFLDEGHTLGNALRYIIMKKYEKLLAPSHTAHEPPGSLNVQSRCRVLRLRHPPSFRAEDEHSHTDLR